MELTHIQRLIAADLDAMNSLIETGFRNEPALAQTISHHILSNRGKQLRPLLLLLAARSAGYSEGEAHIQLAAMIEFIHTATLLHDDVVDNSALRRGQPTANTLWGNLASVLVGDFLYSKAFIYLTGLERLDLIKLMTHAMSELATGEILQLMHCKNPQTTEADYLSIIDKKTASLFAASCHLGGSLGTLSANNAVALREYGLHLGRAFQLIDDKMDYDGDSAIIGKTIGDDLAEGKPTLPLILALKRGNPQQQEIIKQAIVTGDKTQITAIQSILHETNALAYVFELAEQHTALALNCLENLPALPYRQGLADLAELALHRKH